MTTELLALDEISSSQSQKEVTHNTALRQLEGRMVRALDKDLTTPPGSPSNGNTYIVPSGATGVWSGHTNKIAHYYGGAWTFWAPIEGVRLWLSDEDIEYAFDGSAWVVNAGAGLTPPFVDTTAVVKGSADATKKVRFEVDGLTTATTRVLTVQNRDYTIAGTDDITTHEAAADPHTGYQKESEKAVANGYASLDSGGLVPAAQLPSASSLPVPDTTEIVKGSADATKKVRFEVDGLTTATTRVLTVKNKDYTIAADHNLVVQQVVFAYTTDVAVGDGAGYVVVPAALNGLDLVRVHARVITAGTTGTTDIQIHNVTQAADMLSTKITIDSTETGSDTAATPPVIDTGNDDVATNDLLRIDVDAVSTTKPKGLILTLEFA